MNLHTNTNISGIQLAENLYETHVKPILQKNYPQLKYAAALIGPGSEVLGYDDEVSRDHHWGPRFQLFLTPEDLKQYSSELHDVIANQLPFTFHGYSCHWTQPIETDAGNQFLEEKHTYPLNHRIEIHSVNSYLNKMLGIDHSQLSDLEWIQLPEQILLEVTKGKIFFDNFGHLTQVHQELSYFPENVRLFKLKTQWEQIGQEKTFVGRPNSTENDLNSQLEAARLVRKCVKVGFLIAKQYTPYFKWFGKAFQDLPLSPQIHQKLLETLSATTWSQREKFLSLVYLALVEEMVKCKIVPELNLQPKSYFTRAQTVVNIEKIIEALSQQIRAPLNNKTLMPAVDQLIDGSNSEILGDPKLFHRFQPLLKKYPNLDT